MVDRSRNILIGIAASVCLFSPLSGFAGDEAPPLFSYEVDGALASGARYSLTVAESPYHPEDGEAGDDWSRWGIDGGFPRTYLAKLTLIVNGQELWIPRKIYQDLSHISSANAYEFHGALRLDLKGGDAASSFRASYLFSGWNIERLVRHGEFPNSRWEFIVEHSSVAAVTAGDDPPLPPAETSLQPSFNTSSDARDHAD